MKLRAYGFWFPMFRSVGENRKAMYQSHFLCPNTLVGFTHGV